MSRPVFFLLILLVSTVLNRAEGQTTQEVEEVAYIPYKPEFLNSIKNVEDIYQDKSGFIWLTTNYGLIRLDGRSAKRVTKFTSPELKSNNFYRNLEVRDAGVTFFRDEPGNLYMPDGFGGIRDAANSEKYFKSLVPDKAIRDSVGRKGMAIILNAGDAYVFSYPGSLERYRSATGFQKTGVTAAFGTASGFFASAGGHVWINRAGQVDRVTGEQVEPMNPIGRKSGDKGPMWLFNSGSEKLFLVSGSRLYRCKADSAGQISAVVIPGIELKNIVTSVYEEPVTGFIYAGSSSGGLEIFQPQRFRSITAAKLPAVEKAFFYSPLVLDSQRTVACLDRSLFLFSRSGIKKIFTGSADFNYAAVFLNDDGRIWFENRGGAIESLDLSGRDDEVRQVVDLNEEIRHILKAGDDIYVLTAPGLYQLKKQASGDYSVNRAWKIFEQHRGEQFNRANTVYFESKDRVLIGHVAGLISLNLTTGEKHELPGFEAANIRTISFVPGLGLMAGSYGDGYFMMQDGKAIRMPVDPKAALNSVHAFIPDAKEYLWMPTNEGLVRVRIEDLKIAAEKSEAKPKFERYTELDGLTSDEFNGGTNPVYAIQGENIILAGSKGLTTFKADDFPAPADYPPVIYNIQGSQHILVESNMAGSSNELIQLFADRVKAPATDHEFVWYRLAPGGMWSVAETNDPVYIDKQWGGQYRIEFLSEDPEIISSLKPLEISLEVKAVWYQTGLFFILSAVASLGLVWLIIRARTYFIEQQRIALQKEVMAKTVQLNAINEELKTRNRELSLSVAETRKQIAFREKVLLVLLHDLKSPMRFVTSSLRRLYSELSAGTKSRNISGELVTSVSGIYKFMEDFHNWVIENNTDQKKTEFVSLPTLLAEIKEFYEQVAVVYGNTLETEGEEIILKTYSFTLKTIIGNLVDNAIKNTSGGIIRIRATDSLTFVNIEVSDTGHGMSPEHLEAVRQRAENSEKVKVPSIGSGVGYSIISEFLRSVNGLICIDSSPGTGTTITISIPKN